MNINVTFAVGGFVGAIIGFGGTMLSTFITRKSEERRQIRELGLRVALAKFEQINALAKGLAAMKGEPFQEMPPFEQFLSYGIRIVEAVCIGNRSAEDIGRIISESARFSNAVTEATKAQNEHQK